MKAIKLFAILSMLCNQCVKAQEKAGTKVIAYFSDNDSSIRLKTEYVIDKHLGGIMFWELSSDIPGNSLLNVIHQSILHSQRNSKPPAPK